MELPRTSAGTGGRFSLGRVLATAGAIDTGVRLASLVGRHAVGDWGDVGAEDAAANELSLADGSRLLSAYETEAGRIWIITEADRASTTCLLPSEY